MENNIDLYKELFKENENYGFLVFEIQTYLSQTRNSMSTMLNIEKEEYLQILNSKDFSNLDYKLLFALYYLGDQVSKNKYFEYKWVPFYGKAVRDKAQEKLEELRNNELDINFLYTAYYLNGTYLKKEDIKSHIEENQKVVEKDIEDFINDIRPKMFIKSKNKQNKKEKNYEK